MEVRQLEDAERPWLSEQLERLWGSSTVVSRGRARDASQLPALVCSRDSEVVGLATYEIRAADCELVTLDAFARGSGTGTRLLEAVADAASGHACRRLWLVTTNDNLRALRFYQRRGLRLVAVHREAVDEARRLKPSIPLVGYDGIPLHDEIELELLL